MLLVLIKINIGQRIKLGKTNTLSSDEIISQDLPKVGYLRLWQVLELIPISKSTWYKGIMEGRYPRASKRFGPRIAAWDVREIRKLLGMEEE